MIDVDDVIKAEPAQTGNAVFEAAVERAKNTTTESKFLPNLTLEQLDDITDEMLEEYALKPEVYRSIPETKLNVFEKLVNRLPVKVVAAIASKPGVLNGSSDEHILAFSRNLDPVYTWSRN